MGCYHINDRHISKPKSPHNANGHGDTNNSRARHSCFDIHIFTTARPAQGFFVTNSFGASPQQQTCKGEQHWSDDIRGKGYILTTRNSKFTRVES